MKRLILHIGLTKTGSSAIQSWLSANSEALAESGVRYATLRGQRPGQISSGNGAHFVRFLIPNRASQKLTKRDRRERLLRELKRTYFAESDVAIVSAEALTNAQRAQIKHLASTLETQEVELSVVAFVRSVYGHFWSGYQQVIKRAGYHGDFATFAAGYPNVQVEALRRWSDEVDDLRVRNYDSAKASLIETFADACDLELPEGIDLSAPRVNRSLSGAERALLIEANRQADERGLEFRALLSNALIYDNPEAASSPVSDPSVIAQLEDRFAEDLRWANSRFLADDPIAIAPSASAKGDGDPAVDVAPETRALIGALMEQIAEPAPYVRGGERKGEEDEAASEEEA